MKFGINVLQVNLYTSVDEVFSIMSHFEGVSHDIISRIKLLPPGECLCSIGHEILICSIFTLVSDESVECVVLCSRQMIAAVTTC